jgi:long-chain fatty acid transport protein
LEGSLVGPFGPATIGIRSNIILPQQVTIGLRQRITPKFTLLAGVEWTNWKAFSAFPVVSTGPVATGATVTTLGFRWRDGWMASIGGEYQWNNKLTLRSGVGYEWSPVTSTTRGLRLPDANRLWVSAGLTYQWSEKLSIDVGYTHLFIPVVPINVTPANPTFNPAAPIQFFGSARAHFDIISIGVNYKFGSRAEAVVAKY